MHGLFLQSALLSVALTVFAHPPAPLDDRNAQKDKIALIAATCRDYLASWGRFPILPEAIEQFRGLSPKQLLAKIATFRDAYVKQRFQYDPGDFQTYLNNPERITLQRFLLLRREANHEMAAVAAARLTDLDCSYNVLSPELIKLLPQGKTELNTYAAFCSKTLSQPIHIFVSPEPWETGTAAFLRSRAGIAVSMQALISGYPGEPEAHEFIHGWWGVLGQEGKAKFLLGNFLPNGNRRLPLHPSYEAQLSLDELVTYAFSLYWELYEYAVLLDKGDPSAQKRSERIQTTLSVYRQIGEFIRLRLSSAEQAAMKLTSISPSDFNYNLVKSGHWLNRKVSATLSAGRAGTFTFSNKGESYDPSSPEVSYVDPVNHIQLNFSGAQFSPDPITRSANPIASMREIIEQQFSSLVEATLERLIKQLNDLEDFDAELSAHLSGVLHTTPSRLHELVDRLDQHRKFVLGLYLSPDVAIPDLDYHLKFINR